MRTSNASNPKRKPVEIVLATWPASKGPRYFGDQDFGSISDCASAWLSLRAFDDDSYEAYTARCVSNIGLWIWMNKDGTIFIEPRVHELHSADLRDFNQLHVMLKKLTKRAGKATMTKFDIRASLISALHCLGIKRVIQYHGIATTDTYVAIETAIDPIVEDLELRLRRLSLAA